MKIDVKKMRKRGEKIRSKALKAVANKTAAVKAKVKAIQNKAVQKPISHEIPLGVKILVLFYGLTILSIIYSYYQYYAKTKLTVLPSAFFLGKAYAGTPAVLFYLITIALLIFVIVDILKLGFWAWWIAVIYSLFNVVSGFASVFMASQYTFITINITLINIVTLWYLWYKRDFFSRIAERKVSGIPAEDKLFAGAYIALYLNMIVFTLLNSSRIIT